MRPDLTTLGKVIGGGMPVGAFGGRREIMEKIAPLGPVYQAGTLSGNPVAVAAGLATLKAIQAPGFYAELSARTRSLAEGLAGAAREAGVPFSAQAVGAMFGIYFAPAVPDSFATVMACDRERFNRFFHRMLDAGVYLAPSAFEAGFVSAAHTAADIQATVQLAASAFRDAWLRRPGLPGHGSRRHSIGGQRRPSRHEPRIAAPANSGSDCQPPSR